MTDLIEKLLVPLEDLTWTPESGNIIEGTTASVESDPGIIGQDRAVKAIRLGLSMKSKGYNIFVAGRNGSGRTATVKKLLEEFNVGGPVPPDICYVNNFKSADQPRLIVVDAGQGAVFKQKMYDLINSLPIGRN